LHQLGHEVWIGDAAEIRASYVRRQKTDRRDAGHILKLLREGRFPRLWTPSREQRDLRQLLIHRHKLVQIRSRVKNGLQHLAMNQGMQKQSRLWSVAGQQAFRQLPLVGWTECRRHDLLELLVYLDAQIAPLDRAATSGRAGSTGAVVADPAGSRADHGPGVRSDHRCGDAFSTFAPATAAGGSHRRIMVEVVAESMVGGTR